MGIIIGFDLFFLCIAATCAVYRSWTHTARTGRLATRHRHSHVRVGDSASGAQTEEEQKWTCGRAHHGRLDIHAPLLVFLQGQGKCCVDTQERGRDKAQ